MSRRGLARHAKKRDANERPIIDALEAHGCLVWPLSGKGIPDLLVFYRGGRTPDGSRWLVNRRTFVADVKGPREKPTPAQVEKWTALTNLGFSVFILRTPEDAVAMLNNALQPWEPEGLSKAQILHGLGMLEKPRANYTPPRSTPVDAATEAEATFAPCSCGECAKCKAWSSVFSPR